MESAATPCGTRLRRLRSEGTVHRRSRPPSSSRRHVEIEQPLGALYSLYGSVEAAGLEPASVVRSLSVLHDPGIAERLELPGDTALVHLERLRLANTSLSPLTGCGSPPRSLSRY